MKLYHALHFSNLPRQALEALTGLLSYVDTEGIEEADDSLTVYIEQQHYDEAVIRQVSEQLNLTFDHSIVEDQNWNSLWESNFQPVYVDDFVALRAYFHTPSVGYEHEIVITPKMSFGTGHHATTWQMIREMRRLDFKGKSVLDFGTGTGVLAIIAAKLGAAKIIAIDYDEWSISNALENIERNGASNIELVQADNAGTGEEYDVILANINRNIILDNMERLVSQLAPGGVILLSGLLEADHAMIIESATAHELKEESKLIKDNWLCLRFSGFAG